MLCSPRKRAQQTAKLAGFGDYIVDSNLAEWNYGDYEGLTADYAQLIAQLLHVDVQVRRYDVFPVKRLTTKEDVDAYLETIRKKLYDTLEANDGIQIN